MLYQMLNTRHALLTPFSGLANLLSMAFSHPLSPLSYTPLARSTSASYDLFHRLTKEYTKPEWGITTISACGIDVGVKEKEVVRKPFCRLIHFKRSTKDLRVLELLQKQPIVLLVAPLSGHHATLLRETVRKLLEDHDVFVTDWTDARMVPLRAGSFGLDDYVSYIQEFIRALGSAKVNVVSVCQPTVPILAAISLLATAGEATPRTMTMMGGPIDARKSPTSVNSLATTQSISWFKNNVIQRVPSGYRGTGRLVYPGRLQHAGFVAMHPEVHMESHIEYFLDLIKGNNESVEDHLRFYDEYNAVMDMPAEYYLDTIEQVFQKHALANGTWKVGGQLVRPQDITKTDLLTIEGELDDISGSGQTRAAHTLCVGIPSKRRFHFDAIGVGHYGIFSGRKGWQGQVYPQVRDFIKKHTLPNH